MTGSGGEPSKDCCFLSLEAPVVRITAPDLPYPVGIYEDRYIPNVDRTLAGIRRAASF